MYVAVLLTLLLTGGIAAGRGVARRSRGRITAGVTLVGLTVAFFTLLDVWGELLWFDAVGYEERFWTWLLAGTGVTAAAALCGFGLVSLLTWPARTAGDAGMDLTPVQHAPRQLTIQRAADPLWAAILGGIIGASWGYGATEKVLRYLFAVPTTVTEPIFGKPIGFYLFALPFYEGLHAIVLALAILAFLAAAVRLFAKPVATGQLLTVGEPWMRVTPRAARSLFVPASVALLAFAWGRYLDIFGLMYSTAGVVTGPGWTDVHVRQPAYWGLTVVAGAWGLVSLVPAAQAWLYARTRLWSSTWRYPLLCAVLLPAVVLAGLWIAGLGVAPALAQWLYVQPNEITVERPYIEQGIRFTHLGFDLEKVEDRPYPYSEVFTADTVADHEALFSEVRLWDWRALDAVYRQFQEIRLYYEFVSLDVDRYRIGDRVRQVLIAAREMEPGNLPGPSQTFVNRRFKYTHGFGLTLAPVHDFTKDGLPRLLVRDIPPVSESSDLLVTRPEIYYGERTRSHVFVNTREPEFHYPRGAKNVYVQYAGEGGVVLSNFWRKLVFGWKFDGTRFLLSTYPTRASRVMFHREVGERVRTLAPFLTFDPDPYVVLANGRLFWIVDAYTTSDRFPYSEALGWEEPIATRNGTQGPPARLTGSVPFLSGSNYVRNSVKVVVDAYDGAVSFYVFDPGDPLIQVWRRIFPHLLRDRTQMPPALQAHVRYPHDWLLAQGLVYAKYHMKDPEVFYNQEDLWVRATEKYYGEVIPVAPYYIMWRPPGDERLEFTVMQPFTPKTRQVLIGWLAGLSDGANYGRLIAYQFPKEKRVLGPQQVETKIDQDPVLSARLSLWDQRGSRVIRGNVLAIPVGETLVYVEPIYLQAETAAYPELRVVAMMHQDNLSYAETFDEALAGLPAGGARLLPAVPAEVASVPAAPVATAAADLARQAREAFEGYLKLQGEGRFREAAAELDRLQRTLDELAGHSRAANKK